MKDNMDRRSFLSRILLLLFSAAAASIPPGPVAAGAGRRLPVERTSRKKADHYRELAG